MKMSLQWPCLTALAMIATGCSQEKPQPVQTDTMRQELTTDSKYMARLHQHWAKTNPGEQMPIDFADEVQYRFLMNRLRASGNTRENAPYLFTRLEKSRARALAATSGSQSAALTSTEEWCGHAIPFTENRNGSQTTFTQNSLITCFGGSEYAYVDMSVYSTNPERTEFTLLNANGTEDYGTKVLETAAVNTNIPVDPNRELFIDSISMAFDDARGLSHTTYAAAETSVLEGKPVLTIEHPVERIGSAYPLDNPIRTCLERGASTGNLDCDYASANKNTTTGVVTPFKTPYTGVAAVDPAASATAKRWIAGTYWPALPSYNTSRLYLPMKGAFSPGSNGSVCYLSDSGFDTARTKADIILLEKGGRCKSTAPSSVVLSSGLPWLPATAGTNVRGFNGLVDFGSDCLGYQQNVRLLVTVYSRANCGPLTNVLRAATVNVQPLDFKNSCLAAGTQIVRANGSSAAVEQLKVGDKVTANGRGLTLTVTSVIEGIESRKMVHLRDARGRDVLVTEKHPLVRGDGTVLAAEKLVAGDTVLARDGATRLTSVERVAYNGQVYNLTLGTEQELAKIGNQERTMIANGFLVGDNQMQVELERQSRRPEDVLASISKSWHQDYHNDQVRKAAARR